MTGRPVLRRPVASKPGPRRGVPGRPVRRGRSIRRASAGLSPVRAGAALVLLLATAAIYGAANSPAFAYATLRVEGASLTAPNEVEATLDAVRGANLFRLATDPLEAVLGELRTVAAADVSVRLPDTLVVTLDERDPILVWRVGARRYLADAEGTLFALVPDDPPATVESLPVVEDRRSASVGLALGRRIDTVDLDAATRLGSLTPADVGSEAERLAVLVTDTSGFLLRARPAGWDAVFGFYTASLRTPELIPGQVRLLRSLIENREDAIGRVTLADDRNGTYTTT